jgi:DNA integrity scanning protein DisA with diadenylate cyclase activity
MNLNEEIIKVLLKVAKRGEGALIIVAETPNVKYKPLVEQNVPAFDVVKNPKLLESLALMDGAVIVSANGIMVAYGVKIESKSVMKNFGTRHSAAFSASKNKGVTSYVLSEEDRKIRVLKEGKIVMQIDTLEKGIEKKVSEISRILEGVGVGTLGTIGAGILATSVGFAGITFIPGVIVFGGAYYLIKKLREKGN